jgi:hypothetical protein
VLAERVEDVRQVRRDLWDEAGRVALAVEEDVVGADVDGDEGDLAWVLVEKLDGVTQLRARPVRAPAVRDHGRGAFAAAAQLDQAEMFSAAVARQLEQLVGVSLVVARGRAVGVRAPDRLRLGSRPWGEPPARAASRSPAT